MKIAMGADHAGWPAKERLKTRLAASGHEVVDFGTSGKDSCDYPDFALAVARSVGKGESERGILICGTGIGMSIAANKVAGVRAALCCSEEMAKLSRAYNDANILCLGARINSESEMERMAESWLAVPFEGGRHGLRVQKIPK